MGVDTAARPLPAHPLEFGRRRRAIGAAENVDARGCSPNEGGDVREMPCATRASSSSLSECLLTSYLMSNCWLANHVALFIVLLDPKSKSNFVTLGVKYCSPERRHSSSHPRPFQRSTSHVFFQNNLERHQGVGNCFISAPVRRRSRI